MSGIALALLGGASASGAVGQSFSAGYVEFLTDGTVQTGSNLGGGATLAGNWYSPTTGGIGSSRWLRLISGGGRSFTPSNGTWIALSSLVHVVNDGIGGTSGTYDIATDAAGVTIVTTGAITTNNQS